MIDVAAIESLELLKNIKNVKQDCLFGVLNKTKTAMGARLLRNNILQPSTLVEQFINPRLDAVQELTENERMFEQLRQSKYVSVSFILGSLADWPSSQDSP